MSKNAHQRKRVVIGDAKHIILSRRLLFVAASIIAAGVILTVKSLPQAIFNITTAIAAISIAYSALRLMACVTLKPEAAANTSTDTAAPDSWPIYTILVPLFREAHMVTPLMAALARLDYPPERLEIIMICEEIDPPTIKAVRQQLRPPFKLVIAPPGHPQTKPRALNIAFKESKGDFITIYDAEDIPSPGQLKAAIAAFRNDKALGAVQAPLDYANSDQTWLTRQFSLEYAALFHVWLPFLASAGLPFPLGGTSNHMRREAMTNLDIGGWDSYNVTEDADLSYRLAAQGWKLGFIHPPTDEEAVGTWREWHFQRARWMKGYMQTWLVHMRRPFLPRGLAGIARFFTLQLTVGLTLLNAIFHAPVIIGLLLFYSLCWIDGMPIAVPRPFIFGFLASYGIGIFIGMVGAVRSGKPRLIVSAFAMPIYWLMLFPPTLRAIWELWRAPFFWHKTEHGVMRVPAHNTHITPPLDYDTIG